MRAVEGRVGERHVLGRRRNLAMEVREGEELMDVVSNYSFCMVQRQLYVSNLSLSFFSYTFFSMKRDEILS